MKPDDSQRRDPAHAVWEAITKDKRVAWRTTEKDRYLYRPRQVLVDSTVEPILRPVLFELGARPRRFVSTEGRILRRLGLRRYDLITDTFEAPDLVDELRKRLDLPLPRLLDAVSLNHVIAAAQVFKLGPGDLPEPDTADPVVTEKTPKGWGSGKKVKVAILDSGFVDLGRVHGLLANGYADEGNDDQDDLYDLASGAIKNVFGLHGTFIAGIIRQRVPDADLEPEVTVDDLGLADEIEVATELLRLRDDVHIVNLSLAGPSKDDAPPQALQRALEHIGDKTKAVVVAAAGNDYELAKEAGVPHVKMWPAAFGAMKGFEHVVGVGAVKDDHTATDFTNRGPWVRACAVGQRLRSTYAKGTLSVPPATIPFHVPTARWSGTSFATPRVVGAIAAAMSGDQPLEPRDALRAVLSGATEVVPELGPFIA